MHPAVNDYDCSAQWEVLVACSTWTARVCPIARREHPPHSRSTPKASSSKHLERGVFERQSYLFALFQQRTLPRHRSRYDLRAASPASGAAELAAPGWGS